MIHLITILLPPFYIALPNDLIEWVGLFLFSAGLIWGVWDSRERDFRWNRRTTQLLVLFLVMAVVFTPFLGIRLSAASALPVPYRPEMPQVPALMFAAAIPWILAGGFLGIVPASIVALLSGVLLAFLDTHTPFTILEVVLLALLYSLAVRQRYRTVFFRLLRQPVVAALGVSILYSLVAVITLTLRTSGEVVQRVDFAITNLSASVFVMGGMVLLGSLIAEIVCRLYPAQWGRQEPLRPSPAEKSLQVRFLLTLGIWVVVLVVVLMVGDWIVAERSARQMLEGRLSSTARVVAESVPYFLESGQNLLIKFAENPGFQTIASKQQVNAALEQSFRAIPYFRQMAVFDQSGQLVASFPEDNLSSWTLSPEEQAWLQLAVQGVTFQSYATAPPKGEASAQINFIIPLGNADSAGDKWVLWGRTSLTDNPFTQPMVNAMQEIQSLGGSGLVLDENGQILYYPVKEKLMTPYLGKIVAESSFYDETAPDGTRQLVYSQPTVGKNWTVILSVPASQVQQLALYTAVPLLFMVLILALVMFFSGYLSLQSVTRSLVTLSSEAVWIAQGQLNRSLPPTSKVDEIGQLSQAFEQMRVSLKERLEELNRLLQVTQAVAATLEIRDSVRPILEAAMNDRACVARLVLAVEEVVDSHLDMPTQFGMGPASDLYAGLDAEILNLTHSNARIVLPNFTRGRGMNLAAGVPHPGALVAIPLRHENRFYGALWVGYDNPRNFTDEDIRFLHTLAGEAALAAANARLYATAEVGRQRLEAVLASTPDPVLVTDQQNHLLLANPAALHLPGMIEASLVGRPIGEVIHQPQLLELLSGGGDNQPSREIEFSNGKVYYATASAVAADDRAVGKVFVLRDITHFKELDAMKSEFVATVSHDLRSPLTLMRGYATMLQMVGDLNDQQKGYVRKIVGGVENMARLVNNLLDLGRIEAGIGLKIEQVRVLEVLDRVVSTLQSQAAQKSVQIDVDVAPEAQVSIGADSALLQQAIYNLVENAIKYTQMNGHVRVNAVQRAGNVVFVVHDNGIGIAPLDQPRLFERFFRGAQREAHEQKGSGLGLAIVKSIAERHTGRVWVESQLGKGSSFYMEIPVSQPEMKARP